MDNKPDKLTSLILEWQRSGEGYAKIIKECSKIIWSYPKRGFNRCDRDLCSNFYIHFYPRLIKLLNDFHYNGKSFHAILNNTMAWQLKTFYRKKGMKNKIETCIQDYSIVEYQAKAFEPKEKYIEKEELKITEFALERLGMKKRGVIAKKKAARNLVILVLKNALFIKQDMLKKISEITGYDEEWLLNAIRILREKCQDRIERFNHYKYRANKTFMELWQVENDLCLCCNTLEKKQLLKKQAQLKQRLKTVIQRKKLVQCYPTNTEIAEIMNMPKGTIDTILFKLKHPEREKAYNT